MAEEEIFILLFQLMIILLAAKFFGEVFKRIGQPEVLGELLAGIFLGPSVLNLISHHQLLVFLAEFGVIILLFEVGLQTDVRTLFQIGRKSAIIAAGGVLLPFLLGYWFGLVLGLSEFVAVFLGATFTATSVGISVRVLSDIGKLDTLEAKTVLGTAIYDDIAGLLLLTILFGLQIHGSLKLLDVVGTIFFSIIFLGASLMLGTRVIPRVIEPIAKMRVRGGLLTFAISLGIFLSFLARAAGLAPIIGAFLAGLLLAETRRKEDIIRDLTPLGHFIVPIFFILMGISVNVRSIVELLPLGLVFIFIACVGKLLGCGVTAYFSGFRKSQALVIGVSMIPRGEVGLIFARHGLNTGLLGFELYALIVLMTIGTTLVAPAAIRRIYQKTDERRVDEVA